MTWLLVTATLILVTFAALNLGFAAAAFFLVLAVAVTLGAQELGQKAFYTHWTRDTELLFWQQRRVHFWEEDIFGMILAVDPVLPAATADRGGSVAGCS